MNRVRGLAHIQDVGHQAGVPFLAGEGHPFADGAQLSCLFGFRDPLDNWTTLIRTFAPIHRLNSTGVERSDSSGTKYRKALR